MTSVALTRRVVLLTTLNALLLSAMQLSVLDDGVDKSKLQQDLERGFFRPLLDDFALLNLDNGSPSELDMPTGVVLGHRRDSLEVEQVEGRAGVSRFAAVAHAGVLFTREDGSYKLSCDVGEERERLTSLAHECFTANLVTDNESP